MDHQGKVTEVTCAQDVVDVIQSCVNADSYLRSRAQSRRVQCAIIPMPTEQWKARARALKSTQKHTRNDVEASSEHEEEKVLSVNLHS